MTKEPQEAAGRVSGVKEQMIETGMAYLRFSRVHSDYFAVMFDSGLDKSKYPELERSARAALRDPGLAAQSERTPELAGARAVSAWALVHGLAALTAENALSMALDERPDFEHVRPLLRQFVRQPYA